MKKTVKSLLISIITGILVSVLCVTGYAAGSISGTVQYDAWTEGTIYVGVFSDPEMNQLVTGAELSSGPGTFELLDINAGSYYVAAFCDVDGDTEPGMGEPFGACPGNPVAVIAGQGTVLSPIVLAGEDPPGSANVKVFYMRYTDGYELEFIASGDLAEVTAVTVDGPAGSGITAVFLNPGEGGFFALYPASPPLLSSLTGGEYTFTFTGGSIEPMVFNFTPGTPMVLPTLNPITYPDVTWQAVTGATEYYIIIYQADGITLVYDGETYKTSETNVDMSSAMSSEADGDYKVKVVAIDSNGNESCSGLIAFTKAASETGSISGTVEYADYSTGTIYIGAYSFADPQPEDTPVGGAELTSLTGGSGGFAIIDLPVGTYYVYASLNTGSGEVFGSSPNNSQGIAVTEGTPGNAGTIVLSGEEPSGGANVKVLYMRYAGGYELEFIASGDLAGIVGVTVDGPAGSDITNFSLTDDMGEFWGVYPSETTPLPLAFPDDYTGDYTFTFSFNDNSTDTQIVSFQPGTPMGVPTINPITYPTVSWQAVTGATEYYIIIY